MEKTAVFVDVQNIYYTVKEQFQAHFNYRAFWQQITTERQLSDAYAYAIDRQNEKQYRFQQILKQIGFTIKLKPFIQRQDGSAKGDWDVGITIDVLACAPYVDTIILASGDGDFDILLNTVREKYQCKTIVYGVSALSAQSLMDAAELFIPIDEPLLLNPR